MKKIYILLLALTVGLGIGFSGQINDIFASGPDEIEPMNIPETQTFYTVYKTEQVHRFQEYKSEDVGGILETWTTYTYLFIEEYNSYTNKTITILILLSHNVLEHYDDEFYSEQERTDYFKEVSYYEDSIDEVMDVIINEKNIPYIDLFEDRGIFEYEIKVN